MKKIFFSVLAFFAAISPAFSDSSFESFQSWAQEQAALKTSALQPVILDKDVRSPASTPSLTWENAKISFNVDSKNFKNSYHAEVNQIMTWSELETFTNYRYEYVDRLQNTTCFKMVCSGGTGKSEAWNRYFAAPKEQKAGALSDAVKGIGDATAKKLVQGGYFSSKPRSWDEFSREINRAVSAGIIQKGAASDILETYRGENSANLGYGAQSCSEQAYGCQKWISVLEQVAFNDRRTIYKKKIIESREFNVEVIVNGALLLPFEKESMQFEITESGTVLGAEGAGELNAFDVVSTKEGNTITITATAKNRALIDFPQKAIARDLFSLTKNIPTFAVEIHSAFMPGADDPAAQMVVDYSVFACTRGFLGICGDWKKLKTSQITFSGARAVVTFTDLPKNSKAYVEYTVSRRNGLYFNNKPTQKRSTDQIRLR